jgi:hypothetical protein
MDQLGTFKVKVVTTREHEDDIDDTQINHMIWILMRSWLHKLTI